MQISNVLMVTPKSKKHLAYVFLSYLIIVINSCILLYTHRIK